MRKYFKYELKRNLLAIIILTVMFMAIQIMNLSNAPIFVGSGGIAFPAHIASPIAILIGASMIVPMFIFSYKNDTKTLDCLYSLPIKSNALVLTKITIAIVMVLIPWTIGYWTGIVVLAIRGAQYYYIHFLTTYVIFVPIAVLFIGFSSFLFTRANRNVDGAFFVLFGSFVLMFLLLPIYAYAHGQWLDFRNSEWILPGNWILFWNIGLVRSVMDHLITGMPMRPLTSNAPIFISIIFLLLCILAWVLLIISAPRQKAENAGNDSNSFYGYRLMIPFVTLSVALSSIFAVVWGLDLNSDIVRVVMIISTVAIVSFVAYVAFRRSFKIKKQDLIVWGSVILVILVAAFVFMLVVYLDNPYFYPDIPL